MKIKSIFAFATTALILTGCSTDIEVEKLPGNSASGVTVEMGEQTLTMSEDQLSSGTFTQIPVVVTGEANGAIEVTVACEGYGENPAISADDYNSTNYNGGDYVITSKTIIIPKGETTGYIEMYPKGNSIENPDKQFSITITKVAGAEIGTNTTTVVTLLDNELMIKNAYQNIQGLYTATATDLYAGGSYSYPMVITGTNDETFELAVTGWDGGENLTAKASLSCDPSTGDVVLLVPAGQILGSVSLSSGVVYDYLLCWYFDGGYYDTTGTFVATSPSDCSKFEFTGIDFFGLVCTPGSTSPLGYISIFADLVLTHD